MRRTLATLSASMLVALAACTDSPGAAQPPPAVRSASVPAEGWEPPAGRRWQGIVMEHVPP